MDPKAKRNLIVAVVIFVVIFLILLLIPLLTRTSTISISKPFIGPGIHEYSQVNNDSIRFFNGRNFIEYDLTTGTTKKLLKDSIYPSLKVIGWSEDSSKVIVYASFYLKNDVFAPYRQKNTQQQQANLWMIDLDRDQFLRMPTGFDKGYFSADGDTIYLTELSTSPGVIHGESISLLHYSVSKGRIVATNQVPYFINSIHNLNGEDVAVAPDNNESYLRLFKITKDGITEGSDLIDPFNIVSISKQGVTTYRENDETEEGEESEIALNATVELYNSNLELVREIDELDGDVDIHSSGNNVIVAFSKDAEQRVVIYNIITNEDEELLLNNTGDSSAENIFDYFSNNSTSLVRTLDGLSILGDQDPVKEYEITDALTNLESTLDAERLYNVQKNEGTYYFTLYDSFNKSLPGIESKINSLGIDPNLLNMTFNEDL